MAARGARGPIATPAPATTPRSPSIRPKLVSGFGASARVSAEAARATSSVSRISKRKRMRDLLAELRSEDEADARQHLSREPPEQERDFAQRTRRSFGVDDHERLLDAERLVGRDVEAHVEIRIELFGDRNVASDRVRPGAAVLARVLTEELERLEER